jgi:hypothetical protein
MWARTSHAGRCVEEMLGNEGGELISASMVEGLKKARLVLSSV